MQGSATRRRFLQNVAALTAAGSVSAAFAANETRAQHLGQFAQAQPYPSRSITLVVPFPPGGSTDVAARILAERMRAPLGQPVIIENVGGAGGRNAGGAAARRAPARATTQTGHLEPPAGREMYPLTFELP